MGRRKRAVARGWEAINSKRDEEAKRLREERKGDDKVSEEEHERRVR